MKECRDLEERYGSDFTSQILNATDFTASSYYVLNEAEDYIVLSFTTKESLEVLSSQCYC